MSFESIKKEIQNFFHSQVQTLKPALDYLESKGGETVLSLGEAVLNEAVAGASWPTLIAALLPAAKAAGISLLENEAGIILNLAKANLDAKVAASGDSSTD